MMLTFLYKTGIKRERADLYKTVEWFWPRHYGEAPTCCELRLRTGRFLLPSIYRITVIDERSTLRALCGLVLSKWMLGLSAYKSPTVTPL